MKSEENILLAKATDYAVRSIKLGKYISDNYKNFNLASQVERCGTSIGANAKEGSNAQSKADFYAKMYIAYKEANESEYWLELLHRVEYIDDRQYGSLTADCKELIKILAAITKGFRDSQKEKNT